MKIGILGGTFNPIHIGHLILAEEVREKLELDRIFFVPAYQAPHKDNTETANPASRYAMVKSAIASNRFFSVSSVEIKRKGPSYTIDTIKDFKKKFGKAELYFITGSDLLTYLDEWKDLNQIIKMVKFVVATRPGYPLSNIPSYIRTMDIRAVDISAFEIRRYIKQGRSFRYLVPDSVFEYINQHTLYRT
ncbi:MAG: nicotinate-nucleotide adenylyltransferase [Candidatus Omnitrophota bacterium]|jgi:nicotinate-nucleotide adenylyltransferase